MPLPTLAVEVDWNASGLFDSEDITADTESLDHLMGRGSNLGMADPATLTLVLSNDDKKYSPDNTGSPLYPNVKSRRAVRVRVTSPVAKTLFLGRIDTLEAMPALDERRVTVQCYDEMVYSLRESEKVFTHLTGSLPLREPDASGVGPFTGLAVHEVIDEQLLWPYGSNLDDGLSEMDTFWVDGDDGLTAVHDLVEEEIGLFYLAGDGQAIFEDRAHRWQADHLTSQATYTDAGAGALRYDDFSPYGFGVENSYNRARGVARPRESAGSLEIFELGESVPISPGETKTIITTWDNPASAFVSSSFVANTAADGSGMDVTANVAKVEGIKKATRAFLQLTNNGGSVAYIISASVTMTIRKRAGREAEFEVEDTAAQADYGIRRFPFEPDKIGKAEKARDYAAIAVDMFKTPAPSVKLGFAAYDTTMLTEMLNRDISDRVTVVNDELGLSADYFVEQIGYSLQAGEDGDKVFRSEMLLSRVPASAPYWILGDSVLGVLGTTTRLAG